MVATELCKRSRFLRKMMVKQLAEMMENPRCGEYLKSKILFREALIREKKDFL